MIVAGADQERQTIDHDPLDESHLAFQLPGGRVYSRVVEEGFPEGVPHTYEILTFKRCVDVGI